MESIILKVVKNDPGNPGPSQVDMIIKEIKLINRRLSPGKLFYRPDWVVLGVNNLCNLHCRMCDVGTQYMESNFFLNLSGSRPVNMPVNLIRKIIEQTAQYFPESKLGYGFTEPLIYPYLIESLEYASHQGLYTTVTTNALTLRNQAVGLAESGLDEIFISLDGPPEIHNQIRGRKNSFQKAMEGIDALLGTGRTPVISVFCVITRWNIGYLDKFLKLFEDIPIKQIGFMHTNFTPKHVADYHNSLYGDIYPATESNVQESGIEEMNLDLLWQEIQQISRTHYPYKVSFSPELSSRGQLEVFYRSPEKLIGKQCHDIFRNIMIKSDGTVIPAHGRCYNLTVGNIYEDDIKSIWNSQVFARFRKTVNKAGGLLPACSRCCSAFH